MSLSSHISYTCECKSKIESFFNTVDEPENRLKSIQELNERADERIKELFAELDAEGMKYYSTIINYKNKSDGLIKIKSDQFIEYLQNNFNKNVSEDEESYIGRCYKKDCLLSIINHLNRQENHYEDDEFDITLWVKGYWQFTKQNLINNIFNKNRVTNVISFDSKGLHGENDNYKYYLESQVEIDQSFDLDDMMELRIIQNKLFNDLNELYPFWHFFISDSLLSALAQRILKNNETIYDAQLKYFMSGFYNLIDEHLCPFCKRYLQNIYLNKTQDMENGNLVYLITSNVFEKRKIFLQ